MQSDYSMGPDFQYILRILNTNVEGRRSESTYRTTGMKLAL